jgi:hypothetical protein
MKRLVPLILAGCSARSVPDPAGVGSAAPVVDEAPAPTAAHGAAIVQLAVADDGNAAVTQDAIGGTRLWPTLDGRREPIVVHVARAAALSLGRVGDGFVIAALDEGGGAELVHVTGAGRLRARASIAPEPPIDSITVAPQGVIVARADHTLEILDANAELLIRTAADQGSRILAVVTRRAHTLVLFSHVVLDEPVTYGRWLDGIEWGTTTPALALTPQSRAALSPNGKRLLIDSDHSVVVLDTETGGLVGERNVGEPIGFIDDETFALRVASEVVWRTLDDEGYRSSFGSVGDNVPFVAGDGVVVLPQLASLALHTKQWVQQLGYRIGDVDSFHVRDDRIIVGSQSSVVVLDEALAQRASFSLIDDAWSNHDTLVDVVPIDDTYTITMHTDRATWRLAVVDFDERTIRPVQHVLTRGDIRYEPTTQLVVITDSVASYLTRWHADTRFEPWYRLAGPPADVHVLDPQQSGDLVAIALRQVNGGLDIAAIHRGDLEIGAPIEARRRHRVPGNAAAVDRAGNVYVIDNGTLVVYRNGLEARRIADAGMAQVAAHPSGAYVAVYGDQRIRMYAATAELRWQVAAPLAQRIAWLGSDLVVDYAGGIGKIDAATGALIKRSCGWTFGFSALSRDDVLAGDSICDTQ